jgi:uncharacterized protein YceH (UPF0502 family)
VTITPEGGRVLGCLVEKQLTTPQQYPLTGNALSLACSQATNRHPVVAMDDDDVLGALDALKAERVVRFVLPSHGRSVVRYRHVLHEVYNLETPALAVLAVLLLRGPQTPGELRTRTARMVEFTSTGDVQEQLDTLTLAAHPDGLARVLPRQPGQKEERWQQLLAEEWATGSGPGIEPAGAADSPFGDRAGAVPLDTPVVGGRGPVGLPAAAGPGLDVIALQHGLGELRAEVSTLRASVAELAAELAALRSRLGG